MGIGRLAISAIRAVGGIVGKSRAKISIAKLGLYSTITKADKKQVINALSDLSNQKTISNINKVSIFESKAQHWGRFADGISIPDGTIIDNITQSAQFIGKAAQPIGVGAKNYLKAGDTLYEKTLREYYKKIGVTIKPKDRFALMKNSEKTAEQIFSESSIIKQLINKTKNLFQPSNASLTPAAI